MNTGHMNNESSMLAVALDSLADRLASRDNLPRFLPDTFEGDILQFPHWEKSFSAMVDGTCSLSQKLYYISKCVGGSAWKAIEGYLSLNSEEGYIRARDLLKKRYGDKYKVARMCKQRISDWPPISTPRVCRFLGAL